MIGRRAGMDPKDQLVIRQLFGSAAPFVEKGAELAARPVAQKVLGITAVGVLAFLVPNLAAPDGAAR